MSLPISDRPDFPTGRLLLVVVAIAISAIGLSYCFAIISSKEKEPLRRHSHNLGSYYQGPVWIARRTNNDLEAGNTAARNTNRTINLASVTVSTSQSTTTTLCSPTRPASAHTANVRDLDRRVPGPVQSRDIVSATRTADASKEKQDEAPPPYAV